MGIIRRQNMLVRYIFTCLFYVEDRGRLCECMSSVHLISIHFLSVDAYYYFTLNAIFKILWNYFLILIKNEDIY